MAQTRHSVCSISIHAPREGSDAREIKIKHHCFVFQSTLPARGATISRRATRPRPKYFNPRSPRGERPKEIEVDGETKEISIHAPREGSDATRRDGTHRRIHFNPRSPRGERHPKPLTFAAALKNFNPRSPRGERRTARAGQNFDRAISIHAPREGSDTNKDLYEETALNFNPRSPRGERRLTASVKGADSVFQSTLPARGATAQKSVCLEGENISIHAPREGSDVKGFCKKSLIFLFQSTLPARGATASGRGGICPRNNFNPRSPRGERQQYCTDIHDPNGNIATRLPNEACLRDERHRFEPKKVI